MGDKAPIVFRNFWQQVSTSRSAFYALVTQDNPLGQQLATSFVADVRAMEPKVDAMNKRPAKDNIWVLQRSMGPDRDPNIGGSDVQRLMAYDYLYKASLQTHKLDVQGPFKGIDSVGNDNNIILLIADDGMVEAAGKPYSVQDQSRLDALKLPLTWQCPQRRYMETRNS